jgi:inward rectifier potassium channel
MSWPRFVGVGVSIYTLINLSFAVLYYACGDGIENARQDSFADMFFFSVQTLATIGYGKMTPVGLIPNLLVALEALIGVISVPMMAGLAYARFTRATAGVIFSKHAVIGQFDDRPALMIRIANQRGDEVLEAQATVVLVYDIETSEGLHFRRFTDLKLSRDRSPLFTLSWTLIHFLDDGLPIDLLDPQWMLDNHAEILVLFTGFHQAFGQAVHARRAYAACDIVRNAQFSETFKRLPDGRRVLDLDHFHDINRLEPQ